MEVGNCFQMVLNDLKPKKEQIKNNLLCLTREKVKTHWEFFSKFSYKCCFFFLMVGIKGLSVCIFSSLLSVAMYDYFGFYFIF